MAKSTRLFTADPDAEPESIAPQEGPQTTFLATNADIAIYGGAAGGGKTWALLLEPLRYMTSIPGFGGVILRRTFPQIMNEGGLWDASTKVYPAAQGEPTKSAVMWEFPPYGNHLAFRHMQHESTLEEDWQGSEIPYIGFDELTHFSKKQFFYMLSRNRSTCGVQPYIRAGCNPDANSWVKSFLEPWLNRRYVGPIPIDPNTGLPKIFRYVRIDPDDPLRIPIPTGEYGPGAPIGPAKSGEVRYFSGEGGTFRYVDKGEYLYERAHKEPIDWTIKSVAFVRSSVFDNKALLKVNPGYVASLKSLPLLEQERLLWGNWDIVEDGNMFRAAWFPIRQKHQLPTRYKRMCAFFDLAGTKPAQVEKKKDDPDYSACILLAVDYDEKYSILDCAYIRDTPGAVEKWMVLLAETYCEQYGGKVEFVYEEEPGSSGKFVTHHLKQLMRGYSFRELRSTGSKIARAKPVSKQAEGPPTDTISILLADWNEEFLAKMTAFPSEDVHDDIPDALSGAYAILTSPLDMDVYRPRFATVSAASHYPYIGTYSEGQAQEELRKFHALHDHDTIHHPHARIGDSSQRVLAGGVSGEGVNFSHRHRLHVKDVV